MAKEPTEHVQAGLMINKEGVTVDKEGATVDKEGVTVDKAWMLPSTESVKYDDAANNRKILNRHTERILGLQSRIVALEKWKQEGPTSIGLHDHAWLSEDTQETTVLHAYQHELYVTALFSRMDDGVEMRRFDMGDGFIVGIPTTAIMFEGSRVRVREGDICWVTMRVSQYVRLHAPENIRNNITVSYALLSCKVVSPVKHG